MYRMAKTDIKEVESLGGRILRIYRDGKGNHELGNLWCRSREEN